MEICFGIVTLLGAVQKGLASPSEA